MSTAHREFLKPEFVRSETWAFFAPRSQGQWLGQAVPAFGLCEWDALMTTSSCSKASGRVRKESCPHSTFSDPRQGKTNQFGPEKMSTCSIAPLPAPLPSPNLLLLIARGTAPPLGSCFIFFLLINVKYPFLRSAQLFISAQASLNTALRTTAGERSCKGTWLLEMSGQWGSSARVKGVCSPGREAGVLEVLCGGPASPACKAGAHCGGGASSRLLPIVTFTALTTPAPKLDY